MASKMILSYYNIEVTYVNNNKNPQNINWKPNLLIKNLKQNVAPSRVQKTAGSPESRNPQESTVVDRKSPSWSEISLDRGKIAEKDISLERYSFDDYSLLQNNRTLKLYVAPY